MGQHSFPTMKPASNAWLHLGMFFFIDLMMAAAWLPLHRPLQQGPIVTKCFYPLTLLPQSGSSDPAITATPGAFASTADNATAVAGVFFADATQEQVTVQEGHMKRIVVQYVDSASLSVHTRSFYEPGVTIEASVEGSNGESHSFVFAAQELKHHTFLMSFCQDQPLGSSQCKTTSFRDKHDETLLYTFHISLFRGADDAQGLWQVCPEYGKWYPENFHGSYFSQFVPNPNPMNPTGCIPLQFIGDVKSLRINPLTVKVTGAGTVTHQGVGICGPEVDVAVQLVGQMNYVPLSIDLNVSVIDNNNLGRSTFNTDFSITSPPYCKDLDTCEYLIREGMEFIDIWNMSSSGPNTYNFTRPCALWEFIGPIANEEYPFGVYDWRVVFEEPGKPMYRGSAYVVSRAPNQMTFVQMWDAVDRFCRQYETVRGLHPCYYSLNPFNTRDGYLDQDVIFQLESAIETLGPISTMYNMEVNRSNLNDVDLPRTLCFSVQLFNESFLSISGARYSDSGTEIYIDFKGRPDIVKTNYVCSDIFAPETMARLSQNTMCSSVVNQIRIVLYGDETIVPGDVTFLKDLAVSLRGRPITGDIPIDGPANPPTPQLDLHDVVVPSCYASGTITVDGGRSMGSLSRDWVQAVWFVSKCEGAADCDNLGAQVLSQEGELDLRIELSEAGFGPNAPGSFEVTLALTNYLGGTKNGTATVTVSGSDDPQPTIIVRGPQVVTRVESFDLEASLNAIMCEDTEITIVDYAWTVLPQPVWSGFGSTKGSRLVVPSFSLGHGWYTFTVSASISTTHTSTPLQATVTYDVWVGPSSPIALLSTLSQSGATKPIGLPHAVTTAQSGSSLTLDSSASYNPDCLKSSAGVAVCSERGLFRWSCCVSEDPFGPNVDECPTNNQCPNSVTSTLQASTGPSVTIDLPPSLPERTHLTFAVTYTQGGLVSKPSFTTVTVRGLPVIRMAVSVTGAIPNNRTEGYIAAQRAEIGIFATFLVGATLPVQYYWNIISPSRLSSSNASLFASDLATGVMLLKPNTLLPGEHLAVEVGVVDSKEAEGKYWVDVSIATPPRGGILQLSGSTGVGSTTVFTAVFTGWMADNDMLFAVEFLTGSGTDASLICLPSVSPQLSFTLPGPSSSIPSTVYVRGMVIDIFSGEAVHTAQQAVTVSTALQDGEGVIAAAHRLLDEQVSTALKVSDYATAISTMYGVASLLNSETSTPSTAERSARAQLVQSVSDVLQSAGVGYSTAVVAVNVLNTALQNGRASSASASLALVTLESVSTPLSSSSFMPTKDVISAFVKATATAWNTVLVSDKTSISRGVKNMLSVGSMLLAGNGGDGYLNEFTSASTSFVAARGSVAYLTEGVKSLAVANVRLSFISGFKAPSSAGCTTIDASLGVSSLVPPAGALSPLVFVSLSSSSCNLGTFSDLDGQIMGSNGAVEVTIPVSGLSENDEVTCVAWDASTSSYSTAPVRTVSSTSSAVTCGVTGSQAVGLQKTDNSGGLPAGAVVGIIAGVLAVIGIIVAVLVIRKRRRRRGFGGTDLGGYGLA